MAFSIQANGNYLELHYVPRWDTWWIFELFDKEESVQINHIFTFDVEELIRTSDFEAVFCLGYRHEDFYVINKSCLDINNDILIHKDFKITNKTFSSEKSVSIFKILDSIYNQTIILGGSEEFSITNEDFQGLIKRLPTSSELKKYTEARVSAVANDFFEIPSDAQKRYEQYLNKKLSKGTIRNFEFFVDIELEKYKYLRDRINEMLNNVESISENQWQKEIAKFILLLFPNYITYIEKLSFNENYSKNYSTKRELDITLLDLNGNIDILEIKKPFESCIISSGCYRDNHIPKRELSGTIVQSQKYLFYLSKLGKTGEGELTKRYADKLPQGMEIRITNPKAMIIMGRSNNLTQEQKFDFEIFKRKYADIIDIITYDDLLNRLDRIISHFERNCHE